ncbi:MAG: ribbon-helix-helix domain-containing protein [Thermoplasmata archaeon]
MKKVQVRFLPEDLRKIEKEVKEGKYPNKSEAIRDKVRKSYILEAIVYMREATEGLDEEEELEKLEKTREKTESCLRY